MSKVTKWFRMHLQQPIHFGEYECVYAKGDLGKCQNFRVIFSENRGWTDLRGNRLPGLNYNPDYFKWRGLASDPASKP